MLWMLSRAYMRILSIEAPKEIDRNCTRDLHTEKRWPAQKATQQIFLWTFVLISITIIIVVFSLTVPLNVLVILPVKTRPRLQTNSNILLAS